MSDSLASSYLSSGIIICMKMTPFLEYIVYDIFDNEPVTWRSMMGAYVLYYEERAFAIISDDELYFKGSEDLASWYFFRGSKQFSYMRNGEETYLSYFSVPAEAYEDKTFLQEWLGVALSATKPPKPRKKKLVH